MFGIFFGLGGSQSLDFKELTEESLYQASKQATILMHKCCGEKISYSAHWAGVTNSKNVTLHSLNTK